MEPLHAFNVGFRNAAKLPFVICFINPFKSICCFSAWKKPPLLEEQPPSEVSKKEITALQAGHSLEKSRLQETHLLNSKPRPGETGRKAGALQNKSRPKFLTKAVPSTTKEEFRNLRNDDFVSKRKRLQRNLVLPERTKGSEVLFGTAPCSLALGRSKRTFFQLFLKSSRDGASPVAEKFSQYAEDRGIPVKRVHRKVLDALCKGGVHQGVCLEASPLRPLAWQEGPLRRVPVGKGSQCIWLVLERIHDPMNLGAVLRTAHFLGVDGIVTCERNSCSLTPVVSKASSGVMEVFDVFSTDDVQDLLKTKSKEGWEVLGTVGHGKIQEEIPVVSCSDFRWTGPTILLLGNEGYGLSPETKMLCHKMLTIAPGRDLEFGVESLNVSVAAGVKQQLSLKNHPVFILRPSVEPESSSGPPSMTASWDCGITLQTIVCFNISSRSVCRGGRKSQDGGYNGATEALPLFRGIACHHDFCVPHPLMPLMCKIQKKIQWPQIGR